VRISSSLREAVQNNADIAICQSILSPAYHFAVQASLSMSAAKNWLSS